jgi:hypothetical protein
MEQTIMSAKKSRSTALAVTGNARREAKPEPQDQTTVKSEPEAEKLPMPQDLLIPAALLLAADAVTVEDPNRPYLYGVYLHSTEGMGRVVGTDGNRMFVSSFKIEGTAPDWLEDGLILSSHGLKARIGMIAKGTEGPMVRVTWAKNQPKVTLSDFDRSMAFQCLISDGVYPEYDRVIPAESFSNLDEEGMATGREWEPVGINSVYLKQVGEVAKTLDAGLAKADRSKKGMVVRAYNGGGTGSKSSPLVFDFSSWAGAILIIMPAKLASPVMNPVTAALLAPAIKLTIAALRAHQTRNLAWAEAADPGFARDRFLAKAKGFELRIMEVLKRAPGLPALAAPVTEQESTTTPDNDGEEASDGEREGQVEADEGKLEVEPAGEAEGDEGFDEEHAEAQAA